MEHVGRKKSYSNYLNDKRNRQKIWQNEMLNKFKRQTTIYFRYDVKKPACIFILYDRHFRNAVLNGWQLYICDTKHAESDYYKYGALYKIIIWTCIVYFILIFFCEWVNWNWSKHLETFMLSYIYNSVFLNQGSMSFKINQQPFTVSS